MKSFTSKNLHMRPLASQDQTMFCALYTDAKTMRFIEPPYDQEKAQKTFNNIVKRNSNISSGFNTWAIVSKKSTAVKANKSSEVTYDKQLNDSGIGLVMLYRKAGKHVLKVTEIGIMLLPQARGRLLAEEAFGSMINYGFNQLELPHINVRFDKRNLATQRISQKIGFSYHKSFSDEVLLTSPKNIFNNNNTSLETISRSQWQNHSLQYSIKVEEAE